MGGSSGNRFCIEKMEFKGMKNEFGEINVGVGWGEGVGIIIARKRQGRIWADVCLWATIRIFHRAWNI